MELRDIHRTFHPNTKEYRFFSASHDTFSKNKTQNTKQVSMNIGKQKWYPTFYLIQAGSQQQKTESAQIHGNKWYMTKSKWVKK